MSDPKSAIIIDDSNDQNLLNLLRTEIGIVRVKKYSSSKDALNIISQYRNINLVFIHFETLLDASFSFVKKAREGGNCNKTKFILLARNSSKEFLVRAANAGISAFILKPYKNVKLIAKVNKLMPSSEKRRDNRLRLLQSVDATLRYKGKELVGGIEDISDSGCLIRTPRFGRMGVEIYDIVTIRVDFDDERFGVNGELVRMEKDEADFDKAISSAFKFTKPSADTSMQFAKFWAHVLKERESV